jgi:FkbH-like protein
MPLFTDLPWLPHRANWTELLDGVHELQPEAAFEVFQTLANSRLDFVRAGRLDKKIERYRSRLGNPGSWPVVRLALLGTSTLSHLTAGIRLGALRRGMLVEIYEGAYGQYRQELFDSNSGLHAFHPDVVCFALDAYHVAGAEGATAEAALLNMQQCWEKAKAAFQCAVVQQTILPIHTSLIGNNENLLPSSPAWITQQINHELRSRTGSCGVYLLSVDTWAALDGTAHWHDRALWNRAKQEVHPRSSYLYGDQLGRLLAALQGRSAKCLVLDLDNTLWGGVIGDDGIDGIVLGQGSAVGEAHLALQRYALQLSQRGIILAICSKNDEGNAKAPFDEHPEMLLNRTDIACFVANWTDKASNLRHIAASLNIGLDALVFVDDNPAERALIRRELPEVAVPELPEEPAEYVQTIAAAGYFEGTQITEEDRRRAEQYRANADRDDLRRSVTDMDSFLVALQMELTWDAFDQSGLSRIVQLMNKTNQFNLTTRRYKEADVISMMRDPDMVTMQLRLTDIYGDNGIIALLIAQRTREDALEIDTWLMSCRVLGRNVEEATLNVLVARARELGCTTLVGTYRPTAKNGMVADHYQRLGFTLVQRASDGSSVWRLTLAHFNPRSAPLRVLEGAKWKTPISIAS